MDKDPYRFDRQRDDTARIRIKFQPDEADTVEDAAKQAGLPIPVYLMKAILDRANNDLDQADRARS